MHFIRTQKGDLLELKNVEIVGCSAEKLPFHDASFDVVFSDYSLEHIPNKRECIRESYRVLKPGGKLVAAVPAAALSLIYPLSLLFGFCRPCPRPAGTQAREGEPVVVKDWKSFVRPITAVRL